MAGGRDFVFCGLSARSGQHPHREQKRGGGYQTDQKEDPSMPASHQAAEYPSQAKRKFKSSESTPKTFHRLSRPTMVKYRSYRCVGAIGVGFC
jgi:hypothetical protein